MVDSTELRPIERRVIQLEASGLDHAEIARRFRRSPEHIRRISQWARLPGRKRHDTTRNGLRPIERRILHLRSRGLDHVEIGHLFRRGPDHVRRVEGLALYKKAMRLLQRQEA